MTAGFAGSTATPRSPTVLVTGANGFVGRALMQAARAFGLRAALRSAQAPDAPVELSAGEVSIVGNIDDRTDWSAALRGIRSVVHLAARVHVMSPSAADISEFNRTNVLGTERLARSAAAAGVNRFIYLSSIKVNGERTEARPFRGDDPPHPLDDYGRSKLDSERRLSRIESETGMRVSVIRPPLVYGPGVKANFLRLLSWAARGAPLPLASVTNARSLVSTWNLCDLICRLLRAEPMSGVFLVSDGCDVSTPDLVRALAAAMGRDDRLFRAPLGLLRAVAALAGKSAEFSRLCGSLQIDMTETCARLDWTPPVTLEEGLRRTAQWYLSGRQAGGRR